MTKKTTFKDFNKKFEHDKDLKFVRDFLDSGVLQKLHLEKVKKVAESAAAEEVQDPLAQEVLDGYTHNK